MPSKSIKLSDLPQVDPANPESVRNDGAILAARLRVSTVVPHSLCDNLRLAAASGEEERYTLAWRQITNYFEQFSVEVL